MTAKNRLFYKFNISHRILFKWIDRETLKRYGVSSTQLAALFYLLNRDGCQLKELSEELFQNKSAITTLVERMEKNDLLRKKSSETDGRAFQLFITPKGKAIGNEALGLLSGFNAALTEGFSSKEVETINRFFDTIIDNFNSGTVDTV
ncbi:MAG: MarR family winged helix-turn-helix transcriptional regulator [Proteobacteria bacterium]|nr:MarR family winged helix-turn-helix transcriptional regulator [Pseudomonadota bacterium]